MVVLLVVSLVGLALAVALFLRAGALERRPELRLTREHELVRQAAEYRRRQAEAEALRALQDGRGHEPRPDDRPAEPPSPRDGP